MKIEQNAQACTDVSEVLARLRKIRARGKSETLLVSAKLSKLRKNKVITAYQYNKVMGISTETKN